VHPKDADALGLHRAAAGPPARRRAAWPGIPFPQFSANSVTRLAAWLRIDNEMKSCFKTMI